MRADPHPLPMLYLRCNDWGNVIPHQRRETNCLTERRAPASRCEQSAPHGRFVECAQGRGEWAL